VRRDGATQRETNCDIERQRSFNTFILVTTLWLQCILRLGFDISFGGHKTHAFHSKEPMGCIIFGFIFYAAPSDHRSESRNVLTHKQLPGDLNSIFRPTSGPRIPPPTSPAGPLQPGTSRDGGSGIWGNIFLSGVSRRVNRAVLIFPLYRGARGIFSLTLLGRKMLQCQSIFKMSVFFHLSLADQCNAMQCKM